MRSAILSLLCAAVIGGGCHTIGRNDNPAFAALVGTTSTTSADLTLFELPREQRQGSRYTLKSVQLGESLPNWKMMAIIPKGTVVRVVHFGEPYGIGASGTIYAFLEFEVQGLGRVEASKTVVPGREPYW